MCLGVVRPARRIMVVAIVVRSALLMSRCMPCHWEVWPGSNRAALHVPGDAGVTVAGSEPGDCHWHHHVRHHPCGCGHVLDALHGGDAVVGPHHRRDLRPVLQHHGLDRRQASSPDQGLVATGPAVRPRYDFNGWGASSGVCAWVAALSACPLMCLMPDSSAYGNSRTLQAATGFKRS